MGIVLNAEELKRFQPNRYPFLMIDYVTDVEPVCMQKAIKSI